VCCRGKWGQFLHGVNWKREGGEYPNDIREQSRRDASAKGKEGTFIGKHWAKKYISHSENPSMGDSKTLEIQISWGGKKKKMVSIWIGDTQG